MRLLSVNVGQPREVEWRGRKIRTSIWKSEVRDRRWAARLNLAGDAQADLVAHGGEHRAVFVYQIDSYRYWQAQLGRSDFGYGHSGRISPSTGCPMARSASGIAIASGVPSLK